MESERAIVLLRLLEVEDVTPDVQKEAEEIDSESKVGTKKLRSRGPNLNFLEMGIPVGSRLKFNRDNVEVEVVSHNKVKYMDIESSLTAVTKQLLNVSNAPATATHWRFEGKLLREIYKETYLDFR